MAVNIAPIDKISAAAAMDVALRAAIKATRVAFRVSLLGSGNLRTVLWRPRDLVLRLLAPSIDILLNKQQLLAIEQRQPLFDLLIRQLVKFSEEFVSIDRHAATDSVWPTGRAG